LVTNVQEEQRLVAMRLEMLAGRALPRGDARDVALTAQWAAFICWVDDSVDRRDPGVAAGSTRRFIVPLRRVLSGDAVVPTEAEPYAEALRGLLERTTSGMSSRWRQRFAADYVDFLDATEEELALRRGGARLALADYVQLRRRTITLLPMLDILERTGHALLVQDARVDDQLADLRRAVADIAGWANDLASGSNDAAAGQDNLVAVVAREHGCPIVEARTRVLAMIERRRAGFRASAAAVRATPGLPGQCGEDVRRYVDLVAAFMEATVHWLASTGRFTPGPRPGGEPESDESCIFTH
jgi:hypothetical protein